MKRIIFLVMVPIALGPTSLTTVSGITFGDWASDHGYGLGAVLPDMVNAKRSSIDDLNGIGDFDALNLSGGGLLAAWDVEPGHHVAIVAVPEPSCVMLWRQPSHAVYLCDSHVFCSGNSSRSVGQRPDPNLTTR